MPACCGHACHLSVVLGVSATAEKGVIRPSPTVPSLDNAKSRSHTPTVFAEFVPPRKTAQIPLKMLHFYKFLTTILTANSSKTRAKKAIKKEPLSALLYISLPTEGGGVFTRKRRKESAYVCTRLHWSKHTLSPSVTFGASSLRREPSNFSIPFEKD